MPSIAIIPARGGSKRIPKKNIKSFVGKPIIEYSISAAISSGIFDEVMVSTDSQEIADIAIAAGAKVPFLRSSNNSDDYASTLDVIDEVLRKYKEELSQEFEFGCCIYPTAPFVFFDDLSKGYQLMIEKGFDTVFPVVPYSFPPQRSIKVDESGKLSLVYPQHLEARSQDLETIYHDLGQYYWFKSEPLIRKGKLWTDNSGVIIKSELEGQDIDNETDWKLAEMKFSLLKESANQ